MLTFIALNTLITFSISILWFFSPLKITLGKILFKQHYTDPLEFEDKLVTINPTLGQIAGCWTCFTFWTSLLIGVVLTFLFSYPIFYPVIAFFTSPGICYIGYSLIRRLNR
jgi:hypothetical protein